MENKYNIKVTKKIKDKYAKNEIFIAQGDINDELIHRFITLPTQLAMECEIEDMEYIRGNSNLNFLSDNWHIKIKVNDFTNHFYEQHTVKLIDKYKDDYYFRDGAYIKRRYKGVPADQLEKFDYKFIKKLIQEVKELHALDKSNLIIFDEELPGRKVFSHGDLRPKNVIYDGEEIKLIDFEWARQNSYLWDVASILVNFGLDTHQLHWEYVIYQFNCNRQDLELCIEKVKEYNENFDSKKYYKIM